MCSGPWRTDLQCTNHVDQTPAKDELSQPSPKHLTLAAGAAHGAGGWQWGWGSPCVSAGKGWPCRADKFHFLYSQRIPGAPLAGSVGIAGEPRSIWSVRLGTGKESELSAEQRLLWKSPRRLLLALRERKISLLFLLSRAEETEAVRTDLCINTHIFHSRINTHGIFCYCNI